MNKSKIESILRLVIQLVGIAVALGLGGEIVPVIGKAITYLVSSLDQVWFAANELIGIAITVYGFFSELKKPLTVSTRWKEREVGAVVIQSASMKGLSADEYLQKVA